MRKPTGFFLYSKPFIPSSSSYYLIDMSNVYIEKKSYNSIIRLGEDPKDFVNDAVKEKLKKEATK